jgi:hypothetical protein
MNQSDGTIISRLASVVVLSLLALQSSVGQADEKPVAAEQTVKRFLKMLADENLKEVREMLARVQAGPELEEDIQDLASISRTLAKDRSRLTFVELKVHRGYAVAVLHEGAADFDPCFLIYQDEKWHVLPEPTNYKKKYYGLSKEDLAQFAELDAWFDGRKAELQKTRKGVRN